MTEDFEKKTDSTEVVEEKPEEPTATASDPSESIDDIDSLLADLADELIEDEQKPAAPIKSESVLPVEVAQEEQQEADDEIDSILSTLDNDLKELESEQAAAQDTEEPVVLPQEKEYSSTAAEESQPAKSGRDDIDSLLNDLAGEIEDLNDKPVVETPAVSEPAAVEPDLTSEETEPENPTEPEKPESAETSNDIPDTQSTGETDESVSPDDQIIENELAGAAAIQTVEGEVPEQQTFPVPGGQYPFPVRLLITCLERINKPFAFLSDVIKDIIGIVAACTCLACLALAVILILG